MLAWIRQILWIPVFTESRLLHRLWVLLTLLLALLHHHHVLLVILHLLLMLLLCEFGVSHLVLRHHDHLLGIHWPKHHLLLVRHVLMHMHRVDSIVGRIHHTWHVWHAWLHVLIAGIFLILILWLLESWVTLLLVSYWSSVWHGRSVWHWRSVWYGRSVWHGRSPVLYQSLVALHIIYNDRITSSLSL